MFGEFGHTDRLCGFFFLPEVDMSVYINTNGKIMIHFFKRDFKQDDP